MSTFDYPDAEVLVCDMLTEHLPQQHGAVVVTFLPDDADARIDAGGVVILVERIGGTDDGVTDRAEVQVSTWASTRPVAWKTSRAVSSIITSYRAGGPVHTPQGPALFVDTTAVTDTATQISTQDPQERRVVGTFRVDTRRQLLAD